VVHAHLAKDGDAAALQRRLARSAVGRASGAAQGGERPLTAGRPAGPVIVTPRRRCAWHKTGRGPTGERCRVVDYPRCRRPNTARSPVLIGPYWAPGAIGALAAGCTTCTPSKAQVRLGALPATVGVFVVRVSPARDSLRPSRETMTSHDEKARVCHRIAGLLRPVDSSTIGSPGVLGEGELDETHDKLAHRVIQITLGIGVR